MGRLTVVGIPQPSPPLPRLRSDLQVVEERQGADTFYVLKDPLAHRFYRLGAVEYQVASLLDGRHDLQTLSETLQQRNIAISDLLLAGFIERLRKLGLLEGAYTQVDAARWQSIRPGEGWTGFHTNPTFVKFPIANPNMILGALSWWAAPLFSRPFVTMTLLGSLCAAVFLWSHRTALATESSYLVTPRGILMSVLTSCLVITCHELAHAVACRRCGGQVPDMGFALYLFQPYFYTDVSDAWLLPRRQRLIITLAGPLLECALWAGSVWLWLYSPPQSEFHQAALTVVVTSAIKLLWNFNPLLRLDGYYLLMDLVNVPNLRTKTLGYWSSVFKAMTRLKMDLGQLKDFLVFGVYGVLSGGFTVLLLAWLLRRLWTVLSWAYPQHHGVVFIVFLALPLLTGALQALYRRQTAIRAQEIASESSEGVN